MQLFCLCFKQTRKAFSFAWDLFTHFFFLPDRSNFLGDSWQCVFFPMALTRLLFKDNPDRLIVYARSIFSMMWLKLVKRNSFDRRISRRSLNNLPARVQGLQIPSHHIKTFLKTWIALPSFPFCHTSLATILNIDVLGKHIKRDTRHHINQ